MKYAAFGSGHSDEGSPVAKAMADCQLKAENLQASGVPYQCRLTDSGESSAGKYQNGDLYYNNDSSSISDSDLEELTFNYVYSDEQCDSLYSGAYTMTVQEGQTSVDLGSCSISVGGGDGVGVCTINDDGSQNCAYDWSGSSTGQVNTINLDGGLPTDGAEISDEMPDYLSQSSDGGASCASGYVTLGGATYCVDQSSVTVTDIDGNPFSAGGGGGDSDGDGDGDGAGDGDGTGDGTDDGTGDGTGDGSCAEGQTCTTVSIPSGYETEVTVESVMASFQTQLEEAPIMNMMPSLPSGSTASCAPISFSIGWIINGSFELDYCSWLINSGVLGLITSIAMFGYCLAAFRIVMGA